MLRSLPAAPFFRRKPSGKVAGRLPALAAAFVVAACAVNAPAAEQWELLGSREPESLGEGLAFVEKSVRREGDSGFFASRKLQVVFFEARFFTLRVIDQGDAAQAVHDDIGAAMQSSFCPVGCNGGFFHPDFRPLGLMVVDGRRVHRFETSKLLSGVVVGDATGIRLLRRAEFRDNSTIHSLLQAGPFLVDRGVTVNGLSSGPSRRRTFLAWNGVAGDGGRWAMGVTSTLSLADLGSILANDKIISEWKVARALNLDGGTSTGLYFDRGAGIDDFVDNPSKRVRSFLGVLPRADLR